MRKFSILSFLNNALMAIACVVMSASVSAHPGHDHQHWLSDFYHISAWLSIVIATTGLFYYVLSKVGKIKREKLSEDR